MPEAKELEQARSELEARAVGVSPAGYASTA